MPRSALFLALLAAVGCPDPAVTVTLCESPTAVLDDAGAATGFERCADGSIHRVQAVATDALIPEAACGGDEAWFSCTTDADCTHGPNGKCIHSGQVTYFEPGEGCLCAYACATDADCDGAACVPPEVHQISQHSQCATISHCATDADCESGECGYNSDFNGCATAPTLACRTVNDSCREADACGDTNADCRAPFYATDAWTCSPAECVDGRPLRVEGVVCLPTYAVPADAARAAWAAIGAAEHASVSGFARFVLQLQALGAPSALVAEAVAAMADEVRHAADAFAIAGTSPGPMDLSGVTLCTEPGEVLTELIVEACVGETLNAASAALGATTARPDLAATLRGVAADETRHAALGWKTVRWILAEHPHLAEHARATLRRAVRELPEAAVPDLPAWGLVGGARYRALARQTVDEVIAPLLGVITEERARFAA